MIAKRIYRYYGESRLGAFEGVIALPFGLTDAQIEQAINNQLLSDNTKSMPRVLSVRWQVNEVDDAGLTIPAIPKLIQDVPVELNYDSIIDEYGQKIRTRLEKGKIEYGTDIYPGGRDTIQDIEEELLDALVYLWVLRKKMSK